MRLLAMSLSAVLAAATLSLASASPCRADTPAGAVTPVTELAQAPRTGTQEEERAYAQRESASPDAQTFAGGGLLTWVLIAVIVIVIVVLVA